MSDIKLNSDGSDIDLSTNSAELVEGVDAIAQHLLIRLRFIKGEFFLNRNDGVPYFEDILKKDPALIVVRAVYRETILETPGVLEILLFDLSVIASIRKFQLDFTSKVTGSDAPLVFSEPFSIG